MRLLFISLMVVGTLILGLFGVKQWSLALPYQRFDHPFLQNFAPPHLVLKTESLDEAKKAQSFYPNIIFWLSLRMTADQKILIIDSEQVTENLRIEALGPERWKGSNLPRYTEQELRIIFPNSPRLEEFLVAFPNQRMILNIVDNAEDIHNQLIEVLKEAQPEKRFLFHSSADIILKSLKDQHPMWLFGSSQSDLMKILTFESIGLQSASPFKGDVFVSPLKLLEREAFNANVLDEVRRREKDIFLGPLETDEEFKKAESFSPNGFIFSHLTLLRNAFPVE